MTEVKLAGEHIPAKRASPLRNAIRWAARFDSHDIATVVLLAALVAVALFTYTDYAISNDEGVQYHYGELIIAYYTSGLKDQSVFGFQNLYLYGGLFDITGKALLLQQLPTMMRPGSLNVRPQRESNPR